MSTLKKLKYTIATCVASICRIWKIQRRHCKSIAALAIICVRTCDSRRINRWNRPRNWFIDVIVAGKHRKKMVSAWRLVAIWAFDIQFRTFFYLKQNHPLMGKRTHPMRQVLLKKYEPMATKIWSRKIQLKPLRKRTRTKIQLLPAKGTIQ